MTNKQIIIHNVDVSECEFYIDSKNLEYNCKQTPQSYFCKNKPDCYYKQLVREKQEHQKAMVSYVQLDLQRIKECEELEKELISFMNGDYCDNGCSLKQQFNQLKADNDKYSLFIEKLCDYTGLECDSEEQAMRALSDLVSQVNKDRYKQTLTEIEEIAKNSIHEGKMLSGGWLYQFIEQKLARQNNGKKT